jgi:hypothetical protein
MVVVCSTYTQYKSSIPWTVEDSRWERLTVSRRKESLSALSIAVPICIRRWRVAYVYTSLVRWLGVSEMSIYLLQNLDSLSAPWIHPCALHLPLLDQTNRSSNRLPCIWLQMRCSWATLSRAHMRTNLERGGTGQARPSGKQTPGQWMEVMALSALASPQWQGARRTGHH